MKTGHTYVPSWASVHSEIARHLALRKKQCLAAYRENPLLILEHSNIERATAQGGYGRRQIYELVQNGADALIGSNGGRIQVVLTEKALYCANQGHPIDEDGVDAILTSHISMKRGTEIGRFGLGFKSVLGVTLQPLFFSRSGSFAFNAAESERQIRSVVRNAERIPYLRLADPIDPIAHAQRDSTLAELMSWSTTVVVLPITESSSSWLPQDISEFPAEFLLFSPHVAELILEDRTKKLKREIRLKSSEGTILLNEGESVSRWKAFSTVHVPSTKAREEAGEFADRESLPLIWAVPMQGRAARGVFWAFFPTEYYTTLSGIVNAPWKTNEDRQNLLTGLFNEEMIETAARLITANLSDLVIKEDPGKYLELLPGRGKEAPNWADEALTEKVYSLAAGVRSLPDQEGVLQHPSSLKLHPADLPKEALEIWASYSGRPTGWCHITVDTLGRRSRAERLLLLAGSGSATLPVWLEALVKDKSDAASLAAIRVAAKVLEFNPSIRAQIETARIVKTADDSFAVPKPGTIFIPTEATQVSEKLTLVHPALLRAEDAKAALQKLGLKEVDAASELESLLLTTNLKLCPAGTWDIIWRLVRRVPMETAIKLLKSAANGQERSTIRVRTAAGNFHLLQRTLLPDVIIPEGCNRDKDVLIDIEFHKGELPVLKELGAVAAPVVGGLTFYEEWYYLYRSAAIESLWSKITTSAKPNREYLQFSRGPSVGPLDPLKYLSEEGKALFTEAMLSGAASEQQWTLRHISQPDRWPVEKSEPPAYWLARSEGRLKTTLGIKPIPAAVSPKLLQWAKFLPVAECSEQLAERLRLPQKLEEIGSKQWLSVHTAAAAVDDILTLAAFYAAVAEVIEPPWPLRCMVGKEWQVQPANQLTVAISHAEAQALEVLGIPFLLAAPEHAKVLCRSWKLLPADKRIKTEVHSVPSGPEIQLLDQYPGLFPKLDAELHDAHLVPCSSLRVECRTTMAHTIDDRDLFRVGANIYFLASLTPAELLDAITSAFKLSLVPEERQSILNYRKLAESRELTHAIRLEKSPAEKLLKAVGEKAIISRLPTGLLASFEREHGKASPARTAELALSVYGVETLRVFRDELVLSGLEPPVVWAGGHSARAFVKSLGFSVEFAGFGQARREPALEVDGPPNLPPLHDFQLKAVSKIYELPKRTDGRRGLLSLPTGAGKTRVAVEALIQMLKRQEINGPILWVAQTDELCEQAVQTWSYVWRAVGPESPLMINRLWSANNADPAVDGTQVVVATIAKLQVCMNDETYNWLAEDTQWVVIDEAHGAIEKSYTSLLEWLGLGRGTDRCPMIGLTATPFRGAEDDTVRLVKRFGAHRLDYGSFGSDPYRELQEMGVLARVDHQLLEGATLELSEKELQDLTRTRLLPAAVTERLGANASRNTALLKTIRGFPKDWPILLFAASVEHAQTMAALLTVEGISAAAISGDTEAGARRHYVESFRRGKLRVLTNYAVLTAGFDAPSVRVIIVARPTYSPVMYQQMIGRGLRGPRNGGKARCLIVNVRDNILRFQENLAFTQFEYLWMNRDAVK